jgi:hypothetical protein
MRAPYRAHGVVPSDGMTMLGVLADAAGVGEAVRALLVEHPPPAGEGANAVAALRDTYAAQERAAVTIAAGLDGER